MKTTMIFGILAAAVLFIVGVLSLVFGRKKYNMELLKDRVATKGRFTPLSGMWNEVLMR